MILDRFGNKAVVEEKSIVNLEPDFFFGNTLSTFSTEDIEKRPYQYHWTVYACAHAIATNISRLDKYLIDESKKKIEKHDIYKVLKKPNPYMTMRNLFEATILYLLLPAKGGNSRVMKGGQCFWITESGKEGKSCDLVKGEIPMQIYPYNEEFISPNKDDAGNFKGWIFQIPGVPSSKIEYAPNEIIRFSNFNPYDWLAGIPAYAPAQMAIMRDIKADVWNNRLFENDAVPNGVLKTEQELTDSIASSLEERWYRKYSGAGNARRIAILGKGLEFQQIQISKKDMEFTEQKGQVQKEILASFGLNRIAIGDYEQINYATLVEGHKMLWEDTYLPIDDILLDAINGQWIQYLDVRQNIEMISDTSQIRILKKDYSRGIAGAKTLYDMGLPPALALQINEIPLTEENIAEYPWLTEKPEKAAPAFGAPAGAPATMQLKKRIFKFNRDEISKISDAYVEKVLAPGENSFYNKLIRFFNDQRNRMQDRVDEFFKQHYGLGTKDLVLFQGIPVEAFLLDFVKETDNLLKIYKPQVLEQLKLERAKLGEELTDIQWNIVDADIQKFVSKRKVELMKIQKTTFNKSKEKVAESIKEGYENNWTIQQYQKGIKEAIGEAIEVRKNQSRTIARTETGIISSTARNEAFKLEGVEFKQWINASDEKVRETHADGTGDGGMILPINHIFPHTQLEYPCESSGDLSEIINCRCTLIAVNSKEG